MAKNKSFIKLEGTLDGLTFYEKDGQSFVKTKSSVSKKRILSDPAYKRTRENMREFGGAAKAGKAVRSAFNSIAKIMGDSNLSGRLTGVMKQVNRNSAGIRGEREIDLVSHSALLEGFEFNQVDPLSAQFFPSYGVPTLNANRDVISWVVPDFDTDSFVSAPEGATHFRLLLAGGLVSNYEFVSALDQYEPTDEEENAFGLVAKSADIPLVGMVGSDITLSVDLGLGAAVSSTVSTVAGIGIIFYQEINGQLYELAQGNALRIALVG